MVTQQAISVWTMGGWQPPVGESMQGFQHQAEDLPNQDSYCIEQYDAISATLCVLADGSGATESFRSGIGSRLAVQAFRTVIEKEIFPLFKDDDLQLSQIEESWSHVGKKVENLWLEDCLNHLLEEPFTEEENQIRVDHSDLIRRPIGAYTTTLSGALLTQKYGLFLHLGDAEVMLTQRSGDTESISESASAATQTAITLGSPHRLPFHPRVISGSDWAEKELVFLATDGVRDAFPDREDLSRHVVGYLNAWRNKGSHKKLSILTRDHCLRFAGESGSGGDATLLIVKRVEKEDILSRGEFEKAWLEFERNRINLLAEVSKSGNDLKKELQTVSTRLRDSAQSTEADLRKTTENLSRAIESIGNDHRQKVDKLGKSIQQHFHSYETGMKENQQEIKSLKKNQQFIYPALAAGAFAFLLAVFALIQVSSVNSKASSVSSEVNAVSSEVNAVIKTGNNEESKNSLNSVISGIRENIKKIEEELSNARRGLVSEERFVKIIAELSGASDAKATQIKKSLNAVRGLPNDMAEIREQLKSLRSDNETLKAKIDNLEVQPSPTETKPEGDQGQAPEEGTKPTPANSTGDSGGAPSQMRLENIPGTNKYLVHPNGVNKKASPKPIDFGNEKVAGWKASIDRDQTLYVLVKGITTYSLFRIKHPGDPFKDEVENFKNESVVKELTFRESSDVIEIVDENNKSVWSEKP